MELPISLNPENRGLRQVLGDLEADIMECMWSLGSASVREVHECLATERDIAYTTVMTVMSRLADKGMLSRRQDGRAYIYAPVQSRDDFCTGVVTTVMRGLFGSVRAPVLAHFVENLSEDDQTELDALAAMIEQKRKERGSSSPSASV
ncbi:MAG: BlaI/MecI/CopY family transcriptional regulator [Thermoleophilia bacterium]|nr:BlaI/MecI/CopY family transcriptional regulator [Thermoleophilia bacterium]